MKRHAGVAVLSLIITAFAFVLYAGWAALIGAILGWYTFHMLMQVSGLLAVLLFIILVCALS